jgi:hypothetical protein
MPNGPNDCPRDVQGIPSAGGGPQLAPSFSPFPAALVRVQGTHDKNVLH